MSSGRYLRDDAAANGFIRSVSTRGREICKSRVNEEARSSKVWSRRKVNRPVLGSGL